MRLPPEFHTAFCSCFCQGWLEAVTQPQPNSSRGLGQTSTSEGLYGGKRHALLCSSAPHTLQGSELFCAIIRQVTAQASQVFWPQSLGLDKRAGNSTTSLSCSGNMAVGSKQQCHCRTVCSSQHSMNPLP